MNKKQRADTKSTSESVLNVPYVESGFEKRIEKFYWLVIPVLTILYFSYRKIAVGFYQDDEVGQYINMLDFWSNPWVILGNGPKPGYKIFMLLPALISYDAVLIMNSLIASATVYMTYVLLKTYKVSFAIFGSLLLAAQPMFVDLSFRSYSEIFTSLLLVTFLILYKKEKLIPAALLFGYIYTVRQEIALLIIILGIIFLRKKYYVPAICLIVFPLLYNILGYIKTGDPLFVISEMKSVAGLNYKSQGLMHYFKVYIFIVGPVVMTLFLSGFFGFLNQTNRIKEYFSKYFLFYLIFISVFIIQMLTMLNDGPNPGNWRYLLHISPIAAFFATVGLNNLLVKKFRNTFLILSGSLAVLVFLFLSYTTDGFILLDKTDYVKFIFVLLVALSCFLVLDKTQTEYVRTIAVICVILSAAHLYFLQPKKLSPENITIKETAEFVDTLPEALSKPKLTNHAFINFYSSLYKQNSKSFERLNSKTVESSPKGSLLVWESHYGYRPEFTNDVQLEKLNSDTTKFKLLKQFVSSDKRFASFIFEKL